MNKECIKGMEWSIIRVLNRMHAEIERCGRCILITIYSMLPQLREDQ